MSRTTETMSRELRDYMLSVTMREDEVLRKLREDTASLQGSNMQISPEQGQFMNLLVKMIKAEKTLEIGVFTGYSSLWTALALPAGGTIVACDVNAAWTDIARKYWRMAGVEDMIDLRIAPAEETLDGLIREGGEDTFDFAFIDADKASYGTYYEQCMTLVRPGGVIALDNVFLHGRILNGSSEERAIVGMRELNRMISVDERADISMLPIGDGLTLVRKR